MAKSTITAEVKPYQFEPTTVACYSDEESDSDESDTDVRDQASFTERLGRWIGVVARNVYHCHVESSASAVEKWTACMSDWWSGMTSVALPITTNFLSFVLIKTSCTQHW